MRPSTLIIVILAAIMINSSYSQNKENDINSVMKLYFKAGIDFINYTNSTRFKYTAVSSSGKANNFYVALAHQYNKRIQLELQYKNMDGFSYSAETGDYQYEIHGERFYYSAGGSLYSHYINFRANYFVNDNRREDPIYFIGTLSFGLQRVSNWEEFKYEDRIETVNTRFNRFVLGPEAGFGIFFDLGIINFQTEFTFSSRIAPFGNHNNECESSLGINISPVIDLR